MASRIFFGNPPETDITPTTVSLTITTFAPQLKEVIPIPISSLVITTYAPLINDPNTAVSPASISLVITTFAPQLKEVTTPPKTSLVITSFAPLPGLGVIPPTIGLVITTFAPIVRRTSVPTTASLTIVTYLPTLPTLSVPLFTAYSAIAPTDVSTGVINLPLITAFIPISPTSVQGAVVLQTVVGTISRTLTIEMSPGEWLSLGKYFDQESNLVWSRGVGEDHTPEAGTMEFDLNNAEGEFSEGNRFSPFYNKLIPGTRFRFSTTYSTTKVQFTGELTDLQSIYSSKPDDKRVRIRCESTTANLRKTPSYGVLVGPTIQASGNMIVANLNVDSIVDNSPNMPLLKYFWITKNPRDDLAAHAGNSFGGAWWEDGLGNLRFSPAEEFLGGYDTPSHTWGGVISPQGDIAPDWRWGDRFSAIESRLSTFEGFQKGYVAEVGSGRNKNEELFIKQNFRRHLFGQLKGPPKSVDTIFTIDKTRKAGISGITSGTKSEYDVPEALRPPPDSFLLDCTHPGDGKPLARGFLSAPLAAGESSSALILEDIEGFTLTPNSVFNYFRIGGDGGLKDPQEIVRINSSDSLAEALGYYTVSRGEQGTAVREWPIGTYVRQGLRIGSLRGATINRNGDEVLVDGLNYSVILENSVGVTIGTSAEQLFQATKSTPGATADLVRTVESTIVPTAWLNPGRIVTSNDIWATAALGGGPKESNYLTASDWLFNVADIPTSNVIRGIQVGIELSVSRIGGLPVSKKAEEFSEISVCLIRGGVVDTSQVRKLTVNLNESDSLRYVGGLTDMWGTFTKDEIFNSGFGVAIFVSGDSGKKADLFTVSIDHLFVTVTHGVASSQIVTYSLPIDAYLTAMYIGGEYLVHSSVSGLRHVKKVRYLEEEREGSTVELPFSIPSEVTEGYTYSALRTKRIPTPWIDLSFSLLSDAVTTSLLSAELNQLVRFTDPDSYIDDWFRIDGLRCQIRNNKPIEYDVKLSPAHQRRDAMRICHNIGYTSPRQGDPVPSSPKYTEYGDQWTMIDGSDANADWSTFWQTGPEGGIALSGMSGGANPTRIINLSRSLAAYGSSGSDGVVEVTILNPIERPDLPTYRHFNVVNGGVGLKFRGNQTNSEYWAAWFDPFLSKIVLWNTIDGEFGSYPWTPPTDPTTEEELSVRFTGSSIRVFYNQLPNPVIQATSTRFRSNTWIGKYIRVSGVTTYGVKDIIFKDFYGQAL